MPKLKILKIEPWMVMDNPRLLESHPEISPRIGKPGYYLFGKDCWYENYACRAFKDNIQFFVYKLRILQASELNVIHAEILKQLVAERLATKQQKQLLADYYVYQEQKQQIRNFRRRLSPYAFRY